MPVVNNSIMELETAEPQNVLWCRKTELLVAAPVSCIDVRRLKFTGRPLEH
jgi:hypothetical protein